MSEERRAGKRTPIAGVKVTYESAAGTQVEADVLDLAAGGLFIRTETPFAVGKRIALDINVIGEAAPWSALGRVVWVRATAEPGRPAGMGVKLIDVDDATLASIERLVETREPTAPGVGGGIPVMTAPVVAAAPQRERTLMGVAPPSDPPPPLPPPAAAADAESSKVEVQPEPPPPPVKEAPPVKEPSQGERSVAIDLVTQKAPAKPTPSAPPRADSGGGAGGRWVVILLLLVVAGIAAYVLLNGFLTPLGR